MPSYSIIPVPELLRVVVIILDEFKPVKNNNLYQLSIVNLMSTRVQYVGDRQISDFKVVLSSDFCSEDN